MMVLSFWRMAHGVLPGIRLIIVLTKIRYVLAHPSRDRLLCYLLLFLVKRLMISHILVMLTKKLRIVNITKSYQVRRI